jgi:flagellar biosynthesis protein FliR
MPLFNDYLPLMQITMLIFLRVASIILTMPVFDGRNTPILFKAGLALSVTLLLLPQAEIKEPFVFTEALPFGVGVMSEILLGVTIGLSVRLFFAAIQFAGSIAGHQMGFAIANILDPLTSTQISIIAQFKNIVTVLIFLAVDGHHWFIKGIVDSFQLVQPCAGHFGTAWFEVMMKLAGNMFKIAVMVSAPIMIALFFTNIALGIVAKTVPQMNVFMMSFPLTITVGLVFLGFTLPYVVSLIEQAVGRLGSDFHILLRIM